MRISWYPLIAVLKTTSPTVSPRAPNGSPSKTRPSARARTARSRGVTARPPPRPRRRASRRGRPRPSATGRRRTPGRRTAYSGPSSGSARARSRAPASRSRTVTSPGAPGRGSRPAARGRAPARPSARAMRVGRSTTRSRTRCVRQRATAVSSPTMPLAAWSNSTSLSVSAWGAWSVAIASRVPSASASRQASTSPLRPERRRHLRVRVVGAERLVREEQMVRRHLAGDGNAARLRVPEEPHGGRRRHVGDVDRGPGEVGEGDVARDHDLLGRRRDPPQPEVASTRSPRASRRPRERGVLGVRDDRAAERLGVLERPAQQRRVHHRPPVVGVRDAARLGELAELRQLAPGEPAASPRRSGTRARRPGRAPRRGCSP